MKLESTPTGPGKSEDEKQLRAETDALVSLIGEWQLKLYAENKRSLLVVLQGLDASGKDGAIKKVFARVNPMGVRVVSFKKPTENELAHDFLWRVHHVVPPSGMIHVFNRSHYEDILVPTVEGYLPPTFISKRYQQINHFEKLLEESGTSVLKFMLHVSEDEQKDRLKERMTDPKKFWKHKDSDWETFKKRKAYLEVYDEILEKCDGCKWHVIPSDKNWYKEYLIARVVKEKLEELKPNFPPLVTSMKK